MKNLKLLSIVLALLGITGATVLVGWYGFDRVVGAVLSVGAQRVFGNVGGLFIVGFQLSCSS